MNNRVFNWAFAFAHVIPSHKKIFTSTIQKNEELRRLILELKETKGKLSRLDWNAYSNAAISTPFIKKENPAAFIEDLRASISSFSPKIDISIDKEYALIEAERSALVPLVYLHLD
ncbi:hypothetical protein DI09_142p30 [Mitosporidium daphniae]|uniref:Uncharacterized protein n=1 Tax=Mitosporidium daphniae TaxID=1485682 RepID=A0A098VUR2_9MICR|nr:uncharacterized protein DI09_42p200 [Mitosporidium daphniae]XP_013239126.1 uncharacterized protein DI09_142p30 [Mitosporidium daphniae]KGG51177.1 hypothetical protein DI09_42p200 [Mitosporidium daphniae]KGG52690.1 hypothetical protein DI09_142p30 [Mitosporidium daphniae]|eukprot:XP_013237604.1 uncharacterized protein DI09_42p200 [Mitosporidium daphniae]